MYCCSQMPRRTVWILLFLTAAIVGCLAYERLSHADTVSVATVYFDSTDKKFSFVEGKLDKTKGCAWALFNDSIPTTGIAIFEVAKLDFDLMVGWGRLFVETSSQFSDLEQAYAAGLVEGRLTSTYLSPSNSVFVRSYVVIDASISIIRICWQRHSTTRACLSLCASFSVIRKLYVAICFFL